MHNIGYIVMGESLSLITCREKLCYEMVGRFNYQRYIFCNWNCSSFHLPRGIRYLKQLIYVLREN